MLEIANINVNSTEEEEKVQILKNINLLLEKKKIYVITGPNGGGKSSLAKTIMGIYKPTSGKMTLDGQDITDLGISERARLGIGYAFQQPPRFKGLKVKEMLKIAAGPNKKISPHDLLFDVGLCAQDYINREINASFSGGELKRIEIASILARDLKVAVFDEPEAGIDLWSFQRLSETFEKMHEETDTTIIIISHQERILRLADQVILIANGEVSRIMSKERMLEEIESIDAECFCKEDCSKGGRASVGLNR